ncbi:MAG: DUF692 domain-containing protein [Burkholderiaceae bacterium]
MAGIGWRHPHYAELLHNARGLQQSGLEFLEVHSENFFASGGAALAVLMQGRAEFPVSLHGVGLALGSAVGIDEWHLDALSQLVKRVEPIRVSDHACFARGRFDAAAVVHAADLLPIPHTRESLENLIANVQRVQDRLQRPIAVENLSAYIHFDAADSSADYSETEFLNTLASRTGCQLLVDVNNIYVNALNTLHLQARTQDNTGASALSLCCHWLDAIAPGHVAELHLAGHHTATDIVIDDHGSRVCADVWALYEHALLRFGPVPTLIEWDTDIPTLNVLLEEAAHADRIRTDACTAANGVPA